MRLVLGKFIAPVPCLLEAAIVLQLALGEYVEAAIIAVLLVFNAALGLLHEGRAQATVATLKSRLALSASVRRDGVWTIVPAAELVPGDVVKLSLGSVVAADVRLAAGAVLLDQSMLTGESMPIEAGPGLETWAGALVRRGEAVAEVTATGTRTKFGRTAELVRTAYVVSSEQKTVFRIVRNLAGFNGAVTLALAAYAYWLGMSVAELIPLILIAVLGTIPVALGFDIDRLRTLTLVTLLFNGQAVFYVVRERRRLWSSWPSRIVIASSVVDLMIIPTMSVFGILMAPLPVSVVLAVFAASVALALVLEQLKVAVFGRLRMA